MTEIIPITYGSDRPTVSARELHDFLEVETDFRHWFPRMTEYGFSEGTDFSELPGQKCPTNNPKNPWTEVTDYQLTLDMAKELCMIQRTEKGKQARQYFLAVEADWNSPEKVMARALDIAHAQLASLKGDYKKLQVENSELVVDKQIMQPKAEYFDEIVNRNLLTNFRDTAKELHVGPKELVSFLLDRKYLYRDKRGNLKPFQQFSDAGLFEVKESVNEKTQWSGTQTLVTPKGRETLRLLMVGKIA